MYKTFHPFFISVSVNDEDDPLNENIFSASVMFPWLSDPYRVYNSSKFAIWMNPTQLEYHMIGNSDIGRGFAEVGFNTTLYENKTAAFAQNHTGKEYSHKPTMDFTSSLGAFSSIWYNRNPREYNEVRVRTRDTTNLILAFVIYTKESVVNTLKELNRRIEMLTAIDKYRKKYRIDKQIPTYVCNLETHEVSNRVTMKGG